MKIPKYSPLEQILITFAICATGCGLHVAFESRVIEATFTEVDSAESEVYDDIYMNVSAYCICEKCCDQFADGITASGKSAVGLLIAAPNNYSFGTRMDVPGYGTALVEDRGGAITGNKIDLLFSSHQKALNWGRQYLKVRVYED